jgi:hypothetical protein
VKYQVKLTVRAQKDVDAAYQWLAGRTTHAGAWLNGLEKAIEGLSELPARWPLARESREFSEPVRQLLYGKSNHRIFTGCYSLCGRVWCLYFIFGMVLEKRSDRMT